MSRHQATHDHDPACEVAHGDREALRTHDRVLVVVYATPLASVLLRWGAELGFATTLLETDPAEVTDEHRRAAGRVVDSPADAKVDARTDVVVTHHDRDDLGSAMAPLLAAGPRWIGIIGSPRHAPPHVDALRAHGVADDLVDRVRRPIGLDIGSRTPAEIGLSVLAGLLADRNDKPVARVG